jgi:hypothetical protein
MKQILILMVMAFFLMASWAMAEEKMDKNEACDLIGDCGDDMVQAAKTMQAECQSLMAKATVLMDKGKMIRGQGLMWADKEMEADGMAIYTQGKKMYESAKDMNDVCELIIAEGEKTKKKYKSGKKSKGSDVSLPKGGEFVPYTP